MNKRKILYLIIPWNKFQGVVFYDCDDSRFWIAIQCLMIKVKLMIWEEQTNRDCNVHTKICMNAMNGGLIWNKKNYRVFSVSMLCIAKDVLKTISMHFDNTH